MTMPVEDRQPGHPEPQSQASADDTVDNEDQSPQADPHAVLLARLRERNAASEANYRIKSGDVP
ncbi:hypothetical protein ACFWEV_35300 [Streptomyces bacillaris]|uniref:hypothetical protein n=1 Tax=Streptomyces bacillaris TaxID=68179 RepID=UPI00364F87BC